jgi:hypothetical protein
MPIKQTITYSSDNRYFAGFLNHIINEVKIDGCVTQKNGKITLLLDDKDEKKLESFSTIVTKYLPHSIFLGDIETKSVDDKILTLPFTSPTYDIALCARCLEDLTRPSSDKYLDDTIKCNHYSNEKTEEKPDYTLYSPHYSNCCTVLLCNASKIDDIFIVTNDEKKVLFSIEKPTIKVTIKDETLKELTGKLYIDIKSPYNIKSSLAGLNAEDSDIDYLFFEDLNITKAVVVQKNVSLIKDTRVSSKFMNFNEDININRFLNIANEMGNKDKAIGASLSLEHGISFMVSNEISHKKVLIFQKFNLSKLMTDMKNSKEKSKLLENFAKKYPTIIDNLKANKKYDLFETLSVILQLNSKNYANTNMAFHSLCDKSYEFRGNGGVKIDMNFDKNGFDYVSFFGSIMSFKLAGTEDSYLAYSIFEAFGDMTIETLNQLKKKFKIDNIVMMGSMFENSILYSRILSKYQLAKPFFSKQFALDD